MVRALWSILIVFLTENSALPIQALGDDGFLRIFSDFTIAQQPLSDGSAIA